MNPPRDARVRWARRLESIVLRGSLGTRRAVPMPLSAAVIAFTRRIAGARDESRAYLWLAGLRPRFPTLQSAAYEVDFTAPGYFDALEDAAYGEYLASNVKLIRHATPDASARVCDLGCGRGQVLALLAEEGYENLTGLEISQAAVDRRAHDSVRLSPGLDEIPADSYDTVCLISVLEHIEPGDVPAFVADAGFEPGPLPGEPLPYIEPYVYLRREAEL